MEIDGLACSSCAVGASLALLRVVYSLGKVKEGFRHSVSESACNGVDAFVIARRSWMWYACLRSDVFVFLILQTGCKHAFAVNPTPSTTQAQAHKRLILKFVFIYIYIYRKRIVKLKK